MEAEAMIGKARIENLFSEFEARKSLLATCTELWNNLSEQFSSSEQSLIHKSNEIDSKLEKLESEKKKALEDLDNRETTISERESAIIARVEEQKQSALLEFEKPSSGTLELSEELRSHCKKMNSEGLLRLMVANRKDSAAVRAEVSDALVEAVDAPRLVLDVVEGFVERRGVKEGISDLRWACATLIQRLVPGFESDGRVPGVARSVGERAGAVAEAWKAKSDGGEGGEVGASEGKFDAEFLKKLVLEFSSRREIPKIAAKLGFGEKMGVLLVLATFINMGPVLLRTMNHIIDELVKSGKEVEAVSFAYESGLTERFPPVSLLKSYLKNSRKHGNALLKNKNYSTAATEQANAAELNSLRALVRCVEVHKLESEFSFDSLKRRLTQLEKAKVEKKKSMASTKPQNKRPRGDGGGGAVAFHAAKAGRIPNAYPSFGGRNPPVHQNPPRYSGRYTYPSSTVYDSPVSASYVPTYGGAHSQNPAVLPQQYGYVSGDASVGGLRAGGSYGAQSSYGAYDYSASAPAPSSAPTYPPTHNSIEVHHLFLPDSMVDEAQCEKKTMEYGRGGLRILPSLEW
ncbi:hypothetical protein Sjap_019872 [Stephania japonica]|uniref:FRIGIDA-like protein n=1 Tax=Stephania japonica TaxID=461633 RepID=A0AAP0F4W9_9MAGN